MRYRYRHDGIGRREKALMVLVFVAIVFSAFVIFSDTQKVAGGIPQIERASIQDLSTDGFVAVKPLADIVENQGIISLTGGCYRMTAGTDPDQAESIRDGLEGVTGPRPNAHELMRDIFNALDIDLLMVKVTELRDGNFFGKILLQQGNTLLSLDSKPSDGIALAIRMDKTIYFNETLLKERGQKIC